MPYDDTPQPSQSRPHRPRLSELSRETTEDDLWDLDGEQESPVKPEPRVPAKAAEESVSEEPPEEEAPAPEEEPAAASPTREPESVEAEERETAVESVESETAPEPAEASTRESSSPPTLSLPSRRDLISLGVLAAVFLGLAIWWIAGQFSDIPTTRIGGDEPQLPVQGEHAKVAKASTYWREPVREGENRDVTRPEVSYIPVVSVKVADGTGALRAIFRTHTGDFVGDSITRVFENGRFLDNGSDTIEFPATDGYETDGDMNGYRVGDDRWSVEIFEGPGANAPGDQFRLLFTIPISPARR